jgi:hypothetical protein
MPACCLAGAAWAVAWLSGTQILRGDEAVDRGAIDASITAADAHPVTTSMSGTRGGLVIVVADEPGMPPPASDALTSSTP